MEPNEENKVEETTETTESVEVNTGNAEAAEVQTGRPEETIEVIPSTPADVSAETPAEDPKV